MAQGVVVDVSTRITGYEQSLAHLRNALSKLDPGSSLARSLSKGLAAAESQIKSLGKNLTPKFTNDAQLDRFVDKFNNIGNIIQDVSQKMQNISAQDLNFEGADESIRQLITRLSELQAELESNINKGIQNTINSSQELSKVFNNLDIDIKDKNPGEIFEALARKAEESAGKVDIASKELVKAQENLAKKQASLSKAESSPINNKEVLQNELQELTSSYTRALETIKQQVTGGLTAMLGADNPQLDKMATAFLGGLTPENLRERLKTLKDSVTAELKNGLTAKDIYTSLFGDLGKGGNAQAVNTAIIARMFPNMSELKAQFDQKINEISTDLTKNQVGTIKELISESDIETALERTLKAIDGAYRKIQGAIAQGQQEVSQAATVRDTAQSNLNAAQAEADQIERTISSLAQEVERVKAENQNLRNEIEQLKQNIENDKAAKAEEVKGLAANAARGAGQWKITTEAANQYSEALDKVHQREQLVGKIEGIVQRWFSIYAAVRMVGNAIRSIISTIKELDKTITDITIVTNMSREDLWGQMPTYTKMAQDYAVSISGVYQVSQLFYQQGLQTNDVLTLTGETLKMARIAGLDYGEATNYKRKCYVA